MPRKVDERLQYHHFRIRKCQIEAPGSMKRERKCKSAHHADCENPTIRIATRQSSGPITQDSKFADQEAAHASPR